MTIFEVIAPGFVVFEQRLNREASRISVQGLVGIGEIGQEIPSIGIGLTVGTFLAQDDIVRLFRAFGDLAS